MIKPPDAGHSGSCGVGFVCNVAGRKNHKIIQWGVEAVRNLTHRGAVGADGKTGDGAGVLFQIPKNFFLKEIAGSGLSISHIDNLAVGVFFLRNNSEPAIEAIFKKRGLIPIGWRTVPTNNGVLGQAALSTKPLIRQVFLDLEDIEKGKRELALYLARRIIEKTLGETVYIPSLSSKIIAYKGMLVATHLDSFYPDLVSECVESAFCIFHQRFSTNTFPDWTLAQPFRVLAHNGEINTIQANRNWISSIEPDVRHEIFRNEQEIIKPVLSGEESDSASLDRIIELLMFSGFSLEHAVNLCIPPAWECCDFRKEEQLRKAEAFFEFQSFLMKPWDGPAAVVLTDGDTVCAHLDRNGLRPLRYTLTEDGIMVLGSETGMIDLEGRSITKKDRLGPGDTLSVDLAGGQIRYTGDIIKMLAEQNPYREWTERFLVKLPDEQVPVPAVQPDITRKQIAFGYSSEEVNVSLKEMSQKAKEPTYSMGDDTPLPALSEKPQLLFRYFKQRFSQVTNPPIDSLRERIVMSLRMNLGHKMNFLLELPEHARRLKIDSPVLLENQMRAIEEQAALKVKRVSLTFQKKYSGALLPAALRKLQEEIVSAVKDGAEILILSDHDISEESPAIPSLLATAASFKALQREKIANRTSIIVETGEAKDIHDIACLIGYNASAVYPYLAFQTIQDMCGKGILTVPYHEAVRNYKKALDDGLLKVLARMGISTLSSYYGSHLFDTVCLNSDFVEDLFTGTPVTIESDGLNEIEQSLLQRHSAGFDPPHPALEYAGTLRYRKGGEHHAWSPSSVVTLHKYIRDKDEKTYRVFSRESDEEPVFIRHLLHYRKGNPIPVEEVEAEEHILKRFFSGAMSVGALSPEAHETIAEACNSMGIKSNSGEGGEDPERYFTIRNSAIKQIASGRFGVTPAYLASARELEIKMAQGAKPGEGGHLPSDKVTGYIGKLRHCSPGIILISPPPHHDIYSIEDLAQLINDLKEANPESKVCVKLVSESGVGTVAAGVAKAYADIVQISGCEGGTGAASLSSIKNAGNYWETGLAETQRVLIENGLRDRITVRVDGGLRTGKDIIIAALLGSEEFGFGTATMIAAGCIMARQCHANTCPTGIATQDERLRKKFKGKAEDIILYFTAVAREVREIMAEMGMRSLAGIIGRTDLLTAALPEIRSGAERIKLDRFFYPYPADQPRRCMTAKNNNPAVSMNRKLLDDLLPYIEKAEPVEREYAIRNVDRSIPATLNYHIALKYRDTGLPPDTVRLTFRGTTGQSFGAFNHKGLFLTLVGDANDYVGKGMFGGRIVIKPSSVQGQYEQVIVGNTVLYGATGGEFYAAGRAGERFAVRNSGATAVIEGTGQHLCEYMTRGTIVVLGEAGHNVGAGMSGGVIYVYDRNDTLRDKLNNSYVQSVPLSDREEIITLKDILETHYHYTGSKKAKNILDDFEGSCQHFKKIIPRVP
jgi:glutamate synthase (NADPH) large chain